MIKKSQPFFHLLFLFLLCFFASTQKSFGDGLEAIEKSSEEDGFAILARGAKLDSAGRKIIKGPVRGGRFNRVHIVSKSVGVIARNGATISNSVIEAPVCIQSRGVNLTVRNNVLKCKLGVKFTGGNIMGVQLINNRILGQMTNRPGAF